MEIRIKKCKRNLVLDVARFMTDAARAANVDLATVLNPVGMHLFEYGGRQKVNDSLSGMSLNGSASTVATSVDDMWKAACATLERLYNGDIRASRAVDSVARHAKALALKKVINVWLARNKGKDLKEYTTKDKDAMAYLELHPELTALAEQIVAATADEEEVDEADAA